MIRIKFEDVEPLTLLKFPELREAYFDFSWDPIPFPDDNWLKEMLNIPEEDPRRMGATIVFESILTSWIVEHILHRSLSPKRIQDVFDWIEIIALHDDDRRMHGALVGVCVCEQIFTFHSVNLPEIWPYLGAKTKEIFRFYGSGGGSIRIDKTIRDFLKHAKNE